MTATAVMSAGQKSSKMRVAATVTSTAAVISAPTRMKVSTMSAVLCRSTTAPSAGAAAWPSSASDVTRRRVMRLTADSTRANPKPSTTLTSAAISTIVTCVPLPDYSRPLGGAMRIVPASTLRPRLAR